MSDTGQIQMRIGWHRSKIQTDRHMDRRTHRRTHRHTQTDRQTQTYTHRHTVQTSLVLICPDLDLSLSVLRYPARFQPRLPCLLPVSPPRGGGGGGGVRLSWYRCPAAAPPLPPGHLQHPPHALETGSDMSLQHSSSNSRVAFHERQSWFGSITFVPACAV